MGQEGPTAKKKIISSRESAAPAKRSREKRERRKGKSRGSVVGTQRENQKSEGLRWMNTLFSLLHSWVVYS